MASHRTTPTHADLVLRHDLFTQGKTDEEVSALTGFPRQTLRTWAVRNGYPQAPLPNGAPKGVRVCMIKGGQAEEDERRALYSRGHTDSEIGELRGVHASVIASWRKTRGLPSNKTSAAGLPTGFLRLTVEEEQERQRLYNEGCNDRELAASLGISVASAQRWRKVRNLPAQSKRP